MPKLRDLLRRRCDVKQGDWVLINDIKGIYIISLSERESVVAIYNSNKMLYKNINTCDMIKTNRINDGRLYKYAKKHVMWVDNKKLRKNKNETRITPIK
jgi:hypothetical protein